MAIKKADEVCQLMCNVIAPSDGDELFQAVLSQHKREFGDEGLQALVAAHRSAPSKRLKTQILSIYASRFTAAELKEIHKPFEDLSDRQIKKARAQAKIEGPGLPEKKYYNAEVE